MCRLRIPHTYTRPRTYMDRYGKYLSSSRDHATVDERCQGFPAWGRGGGGGGGKKIRPGTGTRPYHDVVLGGKLNNKGSLQNGNPACPVEVDVDDALAPEEEAGGPLRFDYLPAGERGAGGGGGGQRA